MNSKFLFYSLLLCLDIGNLISCFRIILSFVTWNSLGTTKIKNLDENIGSLDVNLTEDDVKEISDAFHVNEVAGDRIGGHFALLTWQFATTPPKDKKASV